MDGLTSLRRLRLTTILLVASFAGSVMAAGAVHLTQRYNETVDDTLRANRSSIVTIQNHAAQLFGATFRVLEGIGDVYIEQHKAGAVNEETLHRLLLAKSRTMGFVSTLFILDPKLNAIAGARVFPSAGLQFAGFGGQQALFQNSRGRFVGRMYQTTRYSQDGSRKWYLPVGVPIRSGDDMLGYVLAVVDPEVFGAFYNTLELGAHGQVVMWAHDGQVIAAHSLARLHVGDMDADAAKYADRILAADEDRFAGYVIPYPDRDVIVGHARLADLPLMISVFLDGRDYLADWRRTRNSLAAGAVVVICIMAVFAAIILRQVRRTEQNERALRQAKAVAEEANDAKSRFLAHMSHEFRTPLNAIMGFSEIIKNKVLGQDVAPVYVSYAGHIHRSGEHLLNIVNDILDMAKIESGVQPLQREAVDVTGVVTAAVSFVEGLAAQRGLRVRAERTGPLPPVLADERYTRQVLINLLSNAIKFSPPGFEIQVVARHTAAGAVEIAVADRGPGIDPTLMRRLGEPFLQGNPAVSRGGQGTGLGLSICKHYMDLLGGELLIQSTVGLGTVATIRFPPDLVVAPAKG